MENEQAIVPSSMSGLTLSNPDKQRFVRLGGFINKVRTVQGWNMLGPNDVIHLAAVWDEQLVRKGVPETIFDELINRAVDHRLGFIQRGEQAPTISIELVLAMYLNYRQEVIEKRWNAETVYDRHAYQLESLQEADGDEERMDQHLAMAKNYGREYESFEAMFAKTKLDVATAKEKLDEWNEKLQQITV